ncbi:MAG: hypothetical protein ACPLZ9_06795 [Candidatus Ratteibacteria bacterium]
MKEKKQIKDKLKKLEKDYSPDGKNIRLIGKQGIENRAMVKILNWVLKD